MAWGKLAGVTATGSTTKFDSGVMTANKFLQVQGHFTSGSTFTPQIRVGNTTIDVGNTYTGRRSYNGGSDVTVINQSEITLDGVGNTLPVYFEGVIVNISTEEKLCIFHAVKMSAIGAGTAPARRETVFKWTNTSNQIDIIEFLASAGNISDIGVMAVLGDDVTTAPAVATKVQDGSIFYETDTNKSYVLSSNVWTEL